MSNPQQYIAQGLQTGSETNHAIANVIVDKSVTMLSSALASDFNTILEASLTEAVAQTLSQHAATSQAFAQNFLVQVRTKLAGFLVNSQQTHPIASIPESISLSQLESFDVDLDAEVTRLADEAGTLTFDINPDSQIGF